MMKFVLVLVLVALVFEASAGGGRGRRGRGRRGRGRRGGRHHSRDKEPHSPAPDYCNDCDDWENPCPDACCDDRILICQPDMYGDFESVCVLPNDALKNHFNNCDDVIGGTDGLDCNCEPIDDSTPTPTDAPTPTPTDAPTPTPTDAPTPTPTDAPAPELVCGECLATQFCPVSACVDSPVAPDGPECTGDVFAFSCHCWSSPAGEAGYCAPNFGCGSLEPTDFGCLNNSDCVSGFCVSTCCGDNHCLPISTANCCHTCQEDNLLLGADSSAMMFDDNGECIPTASAGCL